MFLHQLENVQNSQDIKKEVCEAKSRTRETFKDRLAQVTLRVKWQLTPHCIHTHPCLIERNFLSWILKDWLHCFVFSIEEGPLVGASQRLVGVSLWFQIPRRLKQKSWESKASQCSETCLNIEFKESTPTLSTSTWANWSLCVAHTHGACCCCCVLCPRHDSSIPKSSGHGLVPHLTADLFFLMFLLVCCLLQKLRWFGDYLGLWRWFLLKGMGNNSFLPNDILVFDNDSERGSQVFIFSVKDYVAALLQNNKTSRWC